MNRNAGAAASLAVLVAVNILNFYDRHVIGALTEPIRKEFGLSDSQVGADQFRVHLALRHRGLAVGQGCGPVEPKKLLASGMLVWSALTARGSHGHSYTMLLFSRLGFAVGEAVWRPPPRVGSAICFRLPDARVRWPYSCWAYRLVAHSVISLADRWPRPMAGDRDGPGGGAGAAPDSGVAAAGRTGARRRRIARGAGCEVVDPGDPDDPHDVVDHRLRCAAQFQHVCHRHLPARVPQPYSRVDPGEIRSRHGNHICCRWHYGRPVAGRVGDRVIRTRENGRLLAASVLAAIGAPIAYFGIGAGDVFTAIVLIAIAYGTLNAYYGLVYSAIQESWRRRCAAPRWRCTSWRCICAAPHSDRCSPVASAIGWRAVPPTRQVHGDDGSLRAIGLQQAMFIIPVLSLLLGLVLYCGSRTIGADMRKRDTGAALGIYAG